MAPGRGPRDRKRRGLHLHRRRPDVLGPGQGVAARPRRGPPLNRLRLVSANLAERADPAAFARLVRDVGADVVAVQELAPAQAEALAAVLPFGRLDPATDFTGMGIARRTPGLVTRLPLPRRDAYLTEVELAAAGGDVAIEIVNVHVLAPHVPPPWRALAVRRAQLRGLDAHVAASPERRRVLVGDFNATPLWPLYRRLTRRLRDGAWEAARGNGGRPRPTWGPWSGAPRVLRIDHVLVRGVTVSTLRVVDVLGSDHSALVIDLALPDGVGNSDA